MKKTTLTSAPSHFGVVMSNEPAVAAAAADLSQTELISPVNVLLAREERSPVETLRDLEQLGWQWF
jgi:hypothetical protein